MLILIRSLHSVQKNCAHLYSYACENIFSKSHNNFCHCWVLNQAVCMLSVNMKAHKAPIYSVPLRITCEIPNCSIVCHNRICTEDTACITKATECHQHRALSTLTAQRDWGKRARDMLTLFELPLLAEETPFQSVLPTLPCADA